MDYGSLSHPPPFFLALANGRQGRPASIPAELAGVRHQDPAGGVVVVVRGVLGGGPVGGPVMVGGSPLLLLVPVVVLVVVPVPVVLQGPLGGRAGTGCPSGCTSASGKWAYRR